MISKRDRTFSDEIRQAVRDCGTTRYRIWQETDINQGTLSRFVNGGGLSLVNLDRLAALLDLHVSIGRGTRRRSTKARARNG